MSEAARARWVFVAWTLGGLALALAGLDFFAAELVTREVLRGEQRLHPSGWVCVAPDPWSWGFWSSMVEEAEGWGGGARAAADDCGGDAGALVGMGCHRLRAAVPNRPGSIHRIHSPGSIARTIFGSVSWRSTSAAAIPMPTIVAAFAQAIVAATRPRSRAHTITVITASWNICDLEPLSGFKRKDSDDQEGSWDMLI